MENGYDISKIEEMAARARENEPHDKKRTTESGGVEYSFSSGLPKTSLVFLDGEEPDEAVVSAKAPIPYDEDDEPILADAPEDEPEPRLRAPDEEEFNIPDLFVVSDEYSHTDFNDMIPTVWRTYVPRFTEVTERPIRMRDESGVSTPISGTVVGEPSVRVDRVSPSDEKDPAISEDSESARAVVVNVDGQEGVLTGADRLNLYKFGADKRPPQVIISEEEQARREVTELTGHIFTDEPETKDTPVEQAVPQVNEEDYTVPFSRRGRVDTQREPEPSFNLECKVDDGDELPPSERPRGWNADPSHIEVKGRGEYVDHSQREAVKDRFLDTGISIKIRLSICALVAFIALIFEGVMLFGVNPVELIGLGSYQGAFALIDAALVCAMLLIALPECLRALRSLAFGKVVPELMLAILGATLVGYNAVISSKQPVDYPSLAFAFGIVAISAIYATLCLHNGDFAAFKIVSARGNKSIIDIRLTRELEMENITLDGKVDEFKSKIGRPFRCAFATDFEKNTGRCREGYSNNLIVLLLTLGIAIVSGGVMYFIKDGVVSFVTTFALVLSLGAPAFSLLSRKLAYLHMQKEATCSDFAIIGEEATASLSSVDCFTFTDSEVFSGDDVSFRSISLNDIEGDFGSAMSILSSLFASIGGPLDELFYRSLGRRFAPAQDIRIEPDGSRGRVGVSTVIAGTRAYMERQGISIPDERESFLGGTRIMYAAKDGELFAKIKVQYNFSEDFARALSFMKVHGVTPIVYSRDPNIDNELIRFLTGGADVVRVMKRTTQRPDGETVYKRLSSPAVSRGGKGDMLEAVFLAKRYSALQGHLSVTELSACAVGSLLASVLSVSGLATGLPTLIVGAWQLLWCVALFTVSGGSFRKAPVKTKKTKKDD